MTANTIEPTVESAEKATIKRRRKRVTCPHCENQIYIGVVASIDIDEVLADNTQNERSVRLTPQQAELLSGCSVDGTLSAFLEAIESSSVAQHAPRTPRKIGKLMLTVLRTAKQKAIPFEALDMILRTYGKVDPIEIRSGQGIAMISRSGKLEMFIPAEYLLGNGIKRILKAGATGRHEDVDVSQLGNWLRSGKGTVKTRRLLAWMTKVAIEQGEREFFGPCVTCGAFFISHDSLEGHVCQHAKTMSKTPMLQAGLVSPR